MFIGEPWLIEFLMFIELVDPELGGGAPKLTETRPIPCNKDIDCELCFSASENNGRKIRMRIRMR